MLVFLTVGDIKVSINIQGNSKLLRPPTQKDTQVAYKKMVHILKLNNKKESL